MSEETLDYCIVIISFILLKLRSTVAVVTGNTSRIAAIFAKFGNAAYISPFPNSLESTKCMDLILSCRNIKRRNIYTLTGFLSIDVSL